MFEYMFQYLVSVIAQQRGQIRFGKHQGVFAASVVLFILAQPIVARGQFDYVTDEGTIKITQYTGSGGAVTIPGTIDGLPVTAIGYQAFAQSQITSLIIPDSVTSFDYRSFALCYELVSVSMPAGLTNIGSDTFYSCVSLQAIVIPAGVKSVNGFASCSSLSSVSLPPGVVSIEDLAFEGCGSLAGISIPAGVTNVGDFAFYGCYTLREIVLPDGVVNIRRSAFAACPSLTNAIVPDSVLVMGEGVFDRCHGLKTFHFPANMTEIAPHTFQDCSQLESVTIPPGVTNISQYAFWECPSLTNTTLPANLTKLGTFSFAECSNLTRVDLPVSLISIGDRAFYGCTSLQAFGVDQANLNFATIDGVLFDKSQTKLILFPAGRGGTYTVPSGVANIGPTAFAVNQGLTNVTIADTVTNLSDNAFYDCEKLARITIGNSVTHIDNWAFYSCEQLKQIYFRGDAPTLVGSLNTFAPTIVYYLPGSGGWAAAFGDQPTALWQPQILLSSLGVRTNNLGFNILWTDGPSIVVETSTNLTISAWTPAHSNTLSGQTVYFADPVWRDYPKRYYRVRGQ